MDNKIIILKKIIKELNWKIIKKNKLGKTKKI